MTKRHSTSSPYGWQLALAWCPPEDSRLVGMSGTHSSRVSVRRHQARAVKRGRMLRDTRRTHGSTGDSTDTPTRCAMPDDAVAGAPE